MKNSLLSQSVSTQLLFVLVVKTKNYWDKKTLEWGEVLFFVHFSLSLSLSLYCMSPGFFLYMAGIVVL